MRTYRRHTGILVTAAFALAAVCAAGEKVENWENGKPQEIAYLVEFVDTRGRK